MLAKFFMQIGCFSHNIVYEKQPKVWELDKMPIFLHMTSLEFPFLLRADFSTNAISKYIDVCLAWIQTLILLVLVLVKMQPCSYNQSCGYTLYTYNNASDLPTLPEVT